MNEWIKVKHAWYQDYFQITEHFPYLPEIQPDSKTKINQISFPQ